MLPNKTARHAFGLNLNERKYIVTKASELRRVTNGLTLRINLCSFAVSASLIKVLDVIKKQ